MQDDATVKSPGISGPRQQRILLIALSVGMRVLLIAILIYAVTHQDLPQFHGKAMMWRLILFPLVTLIVPAYWWLVERRRGEGYPFALDLLAMAPPLFDTVGNALNLYDRVVWWDDANHFVNPFFIAIALGLLLRRLPLGRVAYGLFIMGICALFGVIWELAEYVSFVQRSPEFNTAYQDTMGDLALDLAGAALGTLVILLIVRRRATASAAR